MLGYPEMAVNDVTLVKMWTRLYMRGQASEYKYQYSKAVELYYSQHMVIQKSWTLSDSGGRFR